MKVLVLGCTGNLGSRLLPALLVHGHTVVVYVRNEAKLRSLVSPALLERIAFVIGDAFDSAAIEKTLLDHDCDALVNSAGNQVKPRDEHILVKIAKSVSDAAIRVGKQRGTPLRAWQLAAFGVLKMPGTQYNFEDYLPKFGTEQHRETADHMQSIPESDLHWSLLCVAMMTPASYTIDVLPEPNHHSFIVAAWTAPGWQNRWWRYIPLIGGFFNVLLGVCEDYATQLEDVADFIAEDLEAGKDEWVGKFVGFRNDPDSEKGKIKGSGWFRIVLRALWKGPDAGVAEHNKPPPSSGNVHK